MRAGLRLLFLLTSIIILFILLQVNQQYLTMSQPSHVAKPELPQDWLALWQAAFSAATGDRRPGKAFTLNDNALKAVRNVAHPPSPGQPLPGTANDPMPGLRCTTVSKLQLLHDFVVAVRSHPQGTGVDKVAPWIISVRVSSQRQAAALILLSDSALNGPSARYASYLLSEAS